MLSGQNKLRSSIATDYELGIDDLPPVYSKYFHISLRFLLKKKIGYLKRWFRLIRSAREGISDNCPTDEFSENGSLRTWVGLIKKHKTYPLESLYTSEGCVSSDYISYLPMSPAFSVLFKLYKSANLNPFGLV